MSKKALKFTCLALLAVVGFYSCKKSDGSLKTYPGNVRLMNYTITSQSVNPFTIPYIENYRFTYNSLNQVDTIFYTSNNPSQINYMSIFAYKGNRIYDTFKYLNGTVFEVDTFITDFNLNIDTTYILGNRMVYAYYDNLLSRIDSQNGSYCNITSYNRNFIKQTYSSGSSTYYTYYTDKKSKYGDFLQIKSLSRYGVNLYNTANLVRSIKSDIDSISINYVIDADSKVTRMDVKRVDTFDHLMVGGMHYHPYSDSSVYNFQYETY